MMFDLFVLGIIYFLITGRLEIHRGVGIYKSRARYTALGMLGGLIIGAVLLGLLPDQPYVGISVYFLSMIGIPVGVYYILKMHGSPYIHRD
ncbi:MAG: hypothetical protein NVS3B3_07100 [Aquirhabdus sp.]